MRENVLLASEASWSEGRKSTPISYDLIFSCAPFFSRAPQAALERLELRKIRERERE